MMRMKNLKIAASNFIKTTVRKFETHSVFNQSTQLGNLNLYKVDPSLQMAMKSFCPSLSVECISTLNRYGALCGSKELYEIADMAEKHRPSLRQFDIHGRRIDVVDYHHSYHQLMDHGIGNGSVAYGFVHASNECHSHTARAAMIYMENMLEPGHCCPLVMSCAAIPLLTRHSTELGNVLLNKIKTMKYDSRDIAVHEKTGATVGMSMTEKQGGSDVRANTTLAFPIDQHAHGSGCNYRLRGHKWFTSAPMSDAFLTLAKVDGSDALSCFIVPRWLPDGSRNTGFRVMRLKEKLADRANASSEVEYADAWAQMIGQPGQGVKTIIEMVQSTRLDCTLGSAATARRALQHAIHHCQGRKAFGSLLIEQPLMRNLLTDLCVEAEAHTLMAFHMASAFDKAQSSGSSEDQDLFRIGVTVSKYFVTKRLPAFTYECLEVFGGNGFVEDFPMSKLFRQSPLNSVWEGSGNVIALDILRGRNQLPTLLEDIRQCKGADSKVDSYISSLESSLQTVLLAQGQGGGAESQAHARNIADRLAIAMQASALLRFGDAKVAECFIASKVNVTGSGVNYGGHVYTPAQRCLLVDADNFHLNFMDIRVIISWLLKIECKYTLSNAADIIIWIFQKVFQKSLALSIGNDFPVCNIWRSVDIINEQFVLNCSKRFLEKLMLCIEHNRRIPSKSSAKLNIERKQFVSFPVDLERSFSPMDTSSDVEVLTEWKLSDVSDAILSFIHKGCSAQSMIAALKLTFWSVYKASELQYLVYASNTTVPMPKQQLHLTFRLPANAYEDADTAGFSECLPDLLWKWSTPASASFISETPTAIDTSRAFCLKLAWERALAAAILIQRCSLAANGNLPAKIVGKETARFLCQIHSSRLMLRSAHTNAAANERRGGTRTALSPAEEEEILFSTQGKFLHIYLNRLLLLMNENVLTSTISYMVSEDVVTQAILLPYNWSSDVGLAVVSALLYKIIRVDREVSMHEADSTSTSSSVYDIIQSTLAENDIEWDAKPIDLEKIPISCGLGLDRRYTVEFMSELETIEKARVQGQQQLLKQYFSIFLCWIPAICVQIDLARRSYLPNHGYHESADEMYGSQLDIVGYKIFLLNLLCFLEMELLAIAGDGSLHSHHWVSQLASNLVKSFLLVKEEVDTIVSTTVLNFDENYQSFNEFAANLDTVNVPEVSGLHTIYFILKFLQRFNQDSTIAVAVLRILQICSPFPAHLRSVSWTMARELHTEHMNFANSVISSHDSSPVPPGMDELLPYIVHLTSGDDVRSAVLDEVGLACTPRDKFTNLLDLLDSALRLPTKGKLSGDCALQNFLTTWMYWWSIDSTTGRLYGVLQCLVDVFKCILADDIEVHGQEANIMSQDDDLCRSSGSHHKPIAFEFPSLTLETLSFHLKLSLAMLPALFALEEPKVKNSSPYEDFFNVSKLATAFYRDFTTVLQEKEEHLWIVLETAPFMVKHSKATLEGIHRYLDRAVEWRLTYRTGSTEDCDRQSCIDYGSVEFLREALEFALMVTVSILVYWKAFDMFILKSRRYEYPKSLSRGVPSVEQACADLAARVSTLASTLSLELQSVDLPTPSEAVSYLSTVLVKELRHVVVDHHRMASQSWVDSSNGGFQEPSSSSTSAGEDTTTAHCDFLVAVEMEDSAAVDGFDNGFSAITTNDGDGWGLYNEEL